MWVSDTGRKVSPDVAERYLKNAYLYCEKNFPDDQRDLKIAVRKLVELAKIYEKRNSHEIGAALAGDQS